MLPIFQAIRYVVLKWTRCANLHLSPVLLKEADIGLPAFTGLEISTFLIFDLVKAAPVSQTPLM